MRGIPAGGGARRGSDPRETSLIFPPEIAEVLLQAKKPAGTGGKMDRKEYEELLIVIEQTIETSVSMGAEHLRGYDRDTHLHGLGVLEKTVKIPDRLYNNSDIDSGDRYLDAIDRLCGDCCKGRIPEDT